MKDYETYVNNGNPEVPEYSKELNIEYFDLRNNNLPGEEMESFENSLACGISSKSSKSFQAQSQGKTLDDVQELANAVTPSGSIVESAGAVVTGTATVVVGASAAVIAFNATNHVQPKMKVNLLDSGSSFVHYNLELSNLDTSKDYDIVVRNNRHEFKLDCVNGENDEYVYNLLPNLQYSISLVSYNELLGEIVYASENFYTLKSEEVLGYSNIEIIYNDDLTCGIKYDTTLVDDKNTLIDDTYIVVKVDTGMPGGDGEWEIFNSMYAEDYMREQEDMYTYSYEDKVHTGTIQTVPEGTIAIELRKMPLSENQYEGELISTTFKEVIYPLNIDDGANYIAFKGDYNLIKESKNINVKKDNLVARISLFNDSNVETKIEKDIDISDGLFNLKQLVKQDTTSYSYQLGYYKADKTFVIIKESDRNTLYGGYYGASFNDINSYTYYQYVNAIWHYDDDLTETVDIELLTDFDNYGNDDCFYKVELYEQVGYDDNYDFRLLDTYEGTGNPVFRNLPVYSTVYDNFPIPYSFKFISMQNYYDGNNGVVAVEMDEAYDEFGVQFTKDIELDDGDFYLRGDGKKVISVDMEYEMSNISDIIQFVDAEVTLYFFKDDSNVITDTVKLSGKDLIVRDGLYYYVVFDDKLPTDIVGYYASYDISYRGLYGGNIRRAITKEKVLMGDVSYKLNASLEKTVANGDGTVSGIFKLAGYMPDNAVVKAKIGSSGDYVDTEKVDGQFVFTYDSVPSGTYIYFFISDEEGNILAGDDFGSYYCYVSDYDGNINNNYSYYTDEPYYHVTFTYNNDGTINIYCNTGLSVSNENDRNIYKLNVYLQSLNEDSEYVDIASVTGVTVKNPVAVFKNIEFEGYASVYNFRYETVYEFTSTYDAKTISESYYGSSFIMGEDNVHTMSPYGQLMGYESYNEDLEQYVVSLTIGPDMVFDKNQTIVFNGTFDLEPISPVSYKLSDCLESYDDVSGYNYVFVLSDELMMAENLTIDIKFNYTLSKENYDALGSNYSGNLYNQYTIHTTGV